MEFRCPNCEALLHSRRTRLCGNCGTVIPEELRLTDEQARLRDEALEQARASARKLADTFSAQPAAGQHQPYLQKPLSAAELIARAETGDLSIGGDFADQFKHRKRKSFWFYVLCLGLLALPVHWLTADFGGLPPSGWILFIGTVLIAAWSARWDAAPCCPNCQRNIRSCPPAHCHICGDKLHDNACPPCGVDYSWSRLLRSHNSGFGAWIAFCPGCGVHLDTSIKRIESNRNTSGG